MKLSGLGSNSGSASSTAGRVSMENSVWTSAPTNSDVSKERTNWEIGFFKITTESQSRWANLCISSIALVWSTEDFRFCAPLSKKRYMLSSVEISRGFPRDPQIGLAMMEAHSLTLIFSETLGTRAYRIVCIDLKRYGYALRWARSTHHPMNGMNFSESFSRTHDLLALMGRENALNLSWHRL